MKFFKTLVLTVIFSAPILLKAQNYQLPIDSSKDTLSFVNWFGKPYKGTQTFIKGIFFTPASKKVYNINNGFMIYRYLNNQGMLPNSFGTGDIVVLSHNKKVKSYYSHINTSPLIKDVPYGSIIGTGQFIGNTRSLPILNKNSGALISIHNQEGFMQPLNYFKVQDSTDRTIKLEKLLLKSGIYQKMLSSSSTVKSVALSLRSSFKVSLLGIEKSSSQGFYQLPKKIEVVITSLETKQIAQKMVLEFDKIINNKLGGVHTVKDLYHRYWLRDFFNLGDWSNKERTQTYLLEAIMTGTNNTKEKYNIEISFR